ncbi:uncharacterized protein LOC141665748 [Apium graveolens]|uniref:uncharacterized protein LOC141665748 n=1 Tax=Apium graveolens TaxID=4045 RepID=UPI003D7A64A6
MAAKEINEDNVHLVEETARMKKARLAGLDTRGKATEPIFLKKHKEPIGEVSTEGAGGHGAPITAAAPTAAATGAFQPLWGFRRGDTVVGSTKHAWDWSYHSVTPKDFTDVVATPDLERIKLMGAQSLASSNAYFQGAVRQAESWKRASDKADNALRRQQKKYATLEKKLKRKEEELGESNAELVVLRAEKDKAIDNYLDSEEFAQSMRIRDDSVFPGFFRTGWDTALGTVNEACPDINPADYICIDDEALLQRFRTRVVVSDHVPQDPLLPPPESSSRPAEDDSSSSSSETTETSSESGEDDDMDAEAKWATPKCVKDLRSFLGLVGYYRKFIRNYAGISRSLTDLMKKSIFQWNEQAQVAFETLKNALVSAPVLALPNFTKMFVLETDASKDGIGAVLIQDNHPLAFLSKSLGPRWQKLSVYEKELLAIVTAIQKWEKYLSGAHFIIKTDQKSLKWLLQQRISTPFQHFWLSKLMGFDYEIQYKGGVDNKVADALSRVQGSEILCLTISVVNSDLVQQINASYNLDSELADLVVKLPQ